MSKDKSKVNPKFFDKMIIAADNEFGKPTIDGLLANTRVIYILNVVEKLDLLYKELEKELDSLSPNKFQFTD